MISNDAELQAGEWLARLDRDDPSPADLAAFDRWKAVDPRRGAAYARLAAAWQALDRVQAIRPRSAEPIDNDYLNNTIHQTPSESARDSSAAAWHSSSSQKRFAHRPWISLSLAAASLFAFVSFWIAYTSGSPQIFTTGIGCFQRIVLADQSAIELNTDSEVRVSLSSQLRNVVLIRGEASFDVAHDASRPFVVSAGHTAVRAIGTKFDVRRLENAVEVTVDEGKVVVGAPEILEASQPAMPPTMLRLSAGETALSAGGSVKVQILAKERVARKLAWRNQMLVFDGDSLSEVVAQFNRYNSRQLIIADPHLATLQIGGYFRPTNLDAFISVLQSDFGIRVATDGNRLSLVTATAD